ncbi:hypothetical protein [Anaerotignum faecicola]|jgi:hypothetical protein|nr:hypothetical protein [Anaerotignum faecicola]
MAKSFEELMELYGSNKIGNADIALGRNNPGALETILKERQNWANATTQEEKTAAHNRAENIRKAYGSYSGGGDGMKGQYSPTYVKPSGAAENSNVDALFNKFNEAYKNPAPTWTPRYEAEIQGLLSDISNRKGFSYNMNEDPMYQQYRDQYIREGQRAMKDTAAQTVALTGGYGSTYGAIAAQQGYDNYLAGLNDRVPQLEQMAYGRYTDELADKYNQLGAYQTEENRLYGQYMDALGQYNTDRNFAFGSMQAAMDQNNYENEFDRNLFESDRNYGLTEEQWKFQQQQQAIENALSTGDYSKLKELGFDISYLKYMQDMEKAQAALTLQQKQLAMAGRASGSSKSKSKTKTKTKTESTGKPTVDGDSDSTTGANGYNQLLALYRLHGNSTMFNTLASQLIQKGKVSEAEYNKLKQQIDAGRLKSNSTKSLLR